MKKFLILGGLCSPLLYYAFPTKPKASPFPPEALMSFEDYCAFKGYKAFSHSITTPDGYILKLFRIFKEDQPIPNKTPVLLVHGLTHSAISFIIAQNSIAPAFKLLENNYDVWLLNTRGNYLSRQHKTLDPRSREYWQFNSNHIGNFDIPASIDYILDSTKRKKINYIGHSQGGFVGLYTLSVKPEYGDKVNLAVVWAPPGGGKISSKAEYLNTATSEKFIKSLEDKNVFFISDYSNEVNEFAADVWKNGKSAAKKHVDRYNIFLENEDTRALVVYLQQFCGGTSVMNLKYLSQIIARNSPGVFRYDYGSEVNFKVYGQAEPPMIDYSKIRAKVAVMYGKHDTICMPQDGENLISLLPKKKVVFSRLDYNLDHAGFAVSPNQEHMDDVLRLFKEHEVDE